MNKIIYLVLITLLFSCSKDEGVERNFSLTIEQHCGGTQFEHCVTESTYDKVTETIHNGPRDPCVSVSFKDLTGNRQSGYFRSSNASSGERDCL